MIDFPRFAIDSPKFFPLKTGPSYINIKKEKSIFETCTSFITSEKNYKISFEQIKRKTNEVA